MFDFFPFGHDDRGIKSGNQNSAEHGRAVITLRQTVFRREVHDGRRDNVLPRRWAILSRNDEYKLKLAKIAAFSKKSSLIHTIVGFGEIKQKLPPQLSQFSGRGLPFISHAGDGIRDGSGP
jgi:hypothetical protein